jgi:hypothetical protein
MAVNSNLLTLDLSTYRISDDLQAANGTGEARGLPRCLDAVVGPVIHSVLCLAENCLGSWQDNLLQSE